MRSLSHNLALCDALDVSVQWSESLATERSATPRFGHGAVVLIVPYPLSLDASQFTPSENHEAPTLMNEHFDWFEYRPRPVPNNFLKRIRDLCATTRQKVGRVDGIVFPEMALQASEYKKLRSALLHQVSFICCGVYTPSKKGKPGVNSAVVCSRFRDKTFVELEQTKHHRWYLDESQICQYGLGSSLDPNRKWWENISLKRRVLTFLSLDSWLTLCVLICEDLARPDPVGNTVRAVGPNLVIALLQDGPQLSSRWSARCATVLADDPGSSVLTLTSSGMAEMSRPAGVAHSDQSASRVVALWKDKETGTREIHFPKGAEAVALCLTNKREEEWSADGRTDGGSASLVKLSGVHPIYPKPGKHPASH